LTFCALACPPAWGDSVRDREWYLNFLHVPDAQKISRGEGVTVAVIDTGVNANQPELTNNLLPGYDDNLGLKGWSDDDGHGTAMASLIAAHGTNASDGALGIAPSAKVLPVKVGVSGSDINAAEVTPGISWAMDHGAKIMSLSLGGGNSRDENEAVSKALAADVVIVASVGNRPEATAVQFPAAYPGVVAVAGVDQNGNHADVSVTGPEVVLSAPAVDIVTPGRDLLYGSGAGTSAAAAIVAGVAALVRAKYPNLSAAEVVHRMTATAIDKGPPGRDDQYGYGIVNPVAALTADVPPLPASPSAGPTKPSATTTSTASPPSKTPILLVGVLVALLVAAGAVGFVIARARTRR
jgi:type VII secretion-associated serine protease mycosin